MVVLLLMAADIIREPNALVERLLHTERLWRLAGLQGAAGVATVLDGVCSV